MTSNILACPIKSEFIKKDIVRAVRRPNIELLLDAVESTEKAAAELANSEHADMCIFTSATVDTGQAGSYQSASQHRRNIDMLLDAVESTKKAADAESSIDIGLTTLPSSAIELDNGHLTAEEADRVPPVASEVVVTTRNGFSMCAEPDLSDTNVVVEKIVTYLGDYSPVKTPFHGLEVVVATTPSSPETNARSKRRKPSSTGKPRRRVVKLKRRRLSRPHPRLKEAAAAAPPVQSEDDRTCDMVVPVDPRLMGTCRSGDEVVANGGGVDNGGNGGDGVVGADGDVSDDDCKNLLEVEVPIPFRSMGTKEAAHSQEAIDFALSHNLIRKFKACPTCGTEVALNVTTLMFRCSRTLKTRPKEESRKKRCQWHQSARPGTWFENAHMSVQGVLHITFLWLVMRRPRQDFVIEQLQCSSRTVVDWASYCREVCVNWAENESEVLGGRGRTVEIYEPKIVNRKRKGTQIMDGKWIFGGFERDTGKLFIVPVPERTRDALLVVVKRWVRPDTVVVSDCWRACKCVGDAAYRRETVQHGYTFAEPERGDHGRLVERVWREVKCSIPRNGPCDLQLLGYLAEFLFKRKFGNSESRTLHFFEMVAKMYPGN